MQDGEKIQLAEYGNPYMLTVSFFFVTVHNHYSARCFQNKNLSILLFFGINEISM